MRSFAVLVTFVALVSVARPAVAATPSLELKDHIDRIVKILQDPALNNRPADRRRDIETVASDIFDFEETARLSLGRHWQERTPAERTEFVRLFSGLIEASYFSRIEGGYEGERVQYTSETVDGDQAIVKTKIVTKKGSEIPIDYRMHRKGERWQVYDVVVEGISLLGNYRSQFNKIIQTSSYQDLVAKLRARASSTHDTATAKDHRS